MSCPNVATHTNQSRKSRAIILYPQTDICIALSFSFAYVVAKLMSSLVYSRLLILHTLRRSSCKSIGLSNFSSERVNQPYRQPAGTGQ
ncbi:hypothetical protein N431DRAFT_102542 [Stipitochalara longipes BDJ]|nr:hypothetical protein N431DRAFT_102542 [Stipitochalara longipes BDJ]